MKNLIFGLLVVCLFGCSDPCKKILCLNSGYCSNGECVCVAGYTGADCSTQKTPTKIIITKIEVLNFPPQNAGSNWDVSSCCPDIYPVIQIASGGELYNGSTDYINDANYTLVNSFNVLPYLELNDVTQQLIIRLYDNDGATSDYLGGYFFTPYSNTNKFPATLNISGADISFKLYLTYEW